MTKFQIEVNGPLRGGDPGRRLIEPQPGGAAPYFDRMPVPFAPRPGEWLLLEAHHIFGSDELSMGSDGIAGQAPQPYLGLGAADSAKLGVTDGQEVAVSVQGNREILLPVRIRPALPAGIALVPCGLPSLAGLALPAWGIVGQAGSGEMRL